MMYQKKMKKKMKMKYKPVLRQRDVTNELIVVGILLALALLPFINGFLQQQIANELDKSGILTQATVLEKRTDTYTTGGGPGGSSTKTAYLVIYGFEVAGQQIVNEVDNLHLYNKVRKDDKIHVRYLPENISIHEIDHSNRYENAASSFRCFGAGLIGLFILLVFIRLPKWRQFRKFELFPKQTVQAHVTGGHRVVTSNSGKGGPSHTYEITYAFETVEDHELFEFVEDIERGLYEQIQIGSKLTVEYVIADPRIARRSLSMIETFSTI